MPRSKVLPLAILFVAALSAACERERLTPTAPDRVVAATNDGTDVKGGGGQEGGGDALVADAIIGDSGCPAAPSTLQSTSPGDSQAFFHVLWKHTRGLIVTPAGSSYSLTDDVSVFTRFKTSDSTLNAVTLYGQDVEGPAGIQHETDMIPITSQAAFATGFTLHVHRSGVTVYRQSGHTGGRRVGSIGTICIGDIVYRVP